MISSVCSHCDEKVLSHWNVCPVCALPLKDTAARFSEIPDHNEPIFERTNILGLACVQCKGVIAPEAQICPHCHVLIVRRYCSGCSRLVPDQSQVCPYCSTPASAKKSRSRLYFQFSSALMVIGTIVAGLYFFVYREPAPPPKAGAPLLLTPVSSGPGLITGSMEAKSEFVPEAPTQKETLTESGEPQEEEDILENPEEDSMETLLENAPEPLQYEGEEPIPAEQSMDIDWQSRGAKLKEGRKLTIRASLLMQKNRYSEASNLLRDAIKMFPPGTRDLSYGEALYKLGICLRRNGDPEQAIPVLRQAMEFPFYRSKVLREVEAATGQLQRAKMSQTRG